MLYYVCVWYTSGASLGPAASCSGESNLSAALCSRESNLVAAFAAGSQISPLHDAAGNKIFLLHFDDILWSLSRRFAHLSSQCFWNTRTKIAWVTFFKIGPDSVLLQRRSVVHLVIGYNISFLRHVLHASISYYSEVTLQEVPGTWDYYSHNI
jgi:hypothetical protein